ncbi:2,3-diaminopropionate biosynthesis protein SbnB [Streptomyces sp. FH025]|uniref:2,3-diaminopropionate biosynthesis protein SbnB n=1 Tax=Streptomyces sp. FH025 TaxID=2815937 RepID=UPI001A9D99DB|nr:2,3-diaminopropionate biosynthesis protein SbnB [Streptomyces sp. FH025]MBO1413066.1 2,3-diaminopropionate biosynthesis protein SbnB [Streptomyces sp. FH025]
MLIIGHDEVRDILAHREKEVLEAVRAAYALHDEGRTALPHSVFLRFPEQPSDRIIGLPAFLDGDGEGDGEDAAVAGFKWVSSFPGNLAAGLPRASAAIVLNSLATGRPEALIEGSLISATRTGASAALAASVLLENGEAESVGLIGLGPINLQVLKYLSVAVPSLRSAVLYDLSPERAAAFAERAAEVAPGLSVTVADSAAEALAGRPLVSIATTAAKPHMDLRLCDPGTVVLHVSLRDIVPEAIVAHHNVVDDTDHVCREQTSLHLTEQLVGDRAFVDAEIGALVRGAAEFRRDPEKVIVFSPFGLGVLDLALARLVRSTAVRERRGLTAEGFLPTAE